MSTNNIDKKRIAQNTLLLYVRQIIVMLVQLYSVRVVLNVLGAEDYGIFNVVAGVVMLLNFLTSTMGSATQRFFSFALGKNDKNLLKEIFDTNIFIYAAIALTAVLFLETAGIWFINCKLNIAAEKTTVAQILFHCVVFRFLTQLVTSPCIGILIAYEDMNIYAGISIFESLLNLAVVLILPFCGFEKLAAYGMLLAISALTVTAVYVTICARRYTEYSFKDIKFSQKIFKETLDFTGWTLFGCLSTIIRTQAITILLNQFFNPVVVASRSVALNISGAVNTFASNFNTGLYPPIIKTWSGGDKEGMFHLVHWGCKITAFLTWIFAIPCLLEMEFILWLWLKTVPPDTVLFSRLILIESLIFSISLPIATAARAPGKMKNYELTLGIIQLLIFPTSWILLRVGCAAYITLVVAIIANMIMFFVRLFIVRALTGLAIKPFCKFVILPVTATIVISALPAYAVKTLLPVTIINSLFVIFLSVVLALTGILFIGFNKQERNEIVNLIFTKLQNRLL